jgi:hypothetical protein
MTDLTDQATNPLRRRMINRHQAAGPFVLNGGVRARRLDIGPEG